MVICVCRGINESDFETEQELHERIMEDDHVCGCCQRYIQNEQTERCSGCKAE